MNRKDFDACACELSDRVGEIRMEVSKLAKKARNTSLEGAVGLDPAAALDELDELLEEVANSLYVTFKTEDEM